MTNWSDKNFRYNFLKNINSEENKRRKARSLQEYEIYNGNINQYVEEYLRQQLSSKTVQKMPIISSIDICKRIADQEASVYKHSPKRDFEEIEESDEEVLESVYFDAQADVKLMKSNRYYKLQGQSLIQVVPKEGKIDFRVLFPHNYDVIPDANDPEKPESIVISAFNKELYVQGGNHKNFASNNYITGNTRDNLNQINADQDDYKSQVERYVVWSNDYNFIMDGNGNIVSGPDIENKLGLLPFVDVASDKDFNYFVDRGSQLANFAVQYNAALSDLANIVRLQAYSQAVLVGAKESMPEEIIVGPTSVIKLAVDANSPVQTDFKFVSPSPDLGGSIQFIEVLISNFLSARGLSPATVSGKSQADKFTSGVDRFLSLIDRFEATKQDFAVFEQIEEKLFEIVKKYLEVYSGTDVLKPKYWASSNISNAELMVLFVKPEQTQSEVEKLDVIQKRMDLGLIDDVTAIMLLDGLNKSEAEEKLMEIQKRSVMLNQPAQPAQEVMDEDGENETEDNGNGS
jgi:hypothetical protein